MQVGLVSRGILLSLSKTYADEDKHDVSRTFHVVTLV